MVTQQAIEPGEKAPETHREKDNPEESHDDDDVCEEEVSPVSFSRSSDGAWNGKENMYLHQQVEKDRRQTESLLTEMKEVMNTL